MGRAKGQKMTEEQKAEMRAKREANKAKKEGDKYPIILDDIKTLSVFQLQSIVKKCNELIEAKKEGEKKNLQAQIEELQKKLESL